MLKFFLMVCVCWLPFSLFAVEEEGLYRYELPTQGQSAEERAQIIKEALAGVLVKVSGDSDTADSSQFSSAYARASDFVLRYRYLPLYDELLWDEGYRQMLRIDFDEESIRQVLRQSDFSVLGDFQFVTLVRLTVTEVSSVEDYARVVHYLKSLREVIHVQVEEVEARQVVLHLNIRGDVAGLEHTIDLSDMIIAIDEPYSMSYGTSFDASEEGAELTYRLIE